MPKHFDYDAEGNLTRTGDSGVGTFTGGYSEGGTDGNNYSGTFTIPTDDGGNQGTSPGTEEDLGNALSSIYQSDPSVVPAEGSDYSYEAVGRLLETMSSGIYTDGAAVGSGTTDFEPVVGTTPAPSEAGPDTTSGDTGPGYDEADPDGYRGNNDNSGQADAAGGSGLSPSDGSNADGKQIVTIGDLDFYPPFNDPGFYDPGYDENGYDENGYDENGYDENGYDEYGYDADGYNASGYDAGGYDADGYDEDGYDEDGYDADGLDADGLDANANITILPLSESDAQDALDNSSDDNRYDENGVDADGNCVGSVCTAPLAGPFPTNSPTGDDASSDKAVLDDGNGVVTFTGGYSDSDGNSHTYTGPIGTTNDGDPLESGPTDSDDGGDGSQTVEPVVLPAPLSALHGPSSISAFLEHELIDTEFSEMVGNALSSLYLIGDGSQAGNTTTDVFDNSHIVPGGNERLSDEVVTFTGGYSDSDGGSPAGESDIQDLPDRSGFNSSEAVDSNPSVIVAEKLRVNHESDLTEGDLSPLGGRDPLANLVGDPDTLVIPETTETNSGGSDPSISNGLNIDAVLDLGSGTEDLSAVLENLGGDPTQAPADLGLSQPNGGDTGSTSDATSETLASLGALESADLMGSPDPLDLGAGVEVFA